MARPHTFTAVGNAQIDTAQFKFGAASGLFDGTGDYITTPTDSDFTFGTGDFTVEFFVRFNSLAVVPQVICGEYIVVGQPLGWIIYVDTDGLHLAYSKNGANGNTDTPKAWSPSTNTWYHVAIVNNGGTITWYVNGTSIGTLSLAGDSIDGLSILFYVGQQSLGSYLNGWVDELRIVKGTAVYTTDFTPPASVLTNVTNTKLLLHFEGADASTTFTDSDTDPGPANVKTKNGLAIALDKIINNLAISSVKSVNGVT